MKNNLELEAILRNAHLKVTPVRRLICEVFSVSPCKPINAEAIWDKLKNKGVNLVTIYRTLSSFEKSGVVKKIDLRKGSAYYEMADHHHDSHHDHHHHLVCVSCGKVEKVDACHVGILAKQTLKKSRDFKVINDHALEFFGMCKKCA